MNPIPLVRAKAGQLTWAREALAYCIERTRANTAHLTSFPEVANERQWHCVENGGWVGGHWTGLLWLAYAHTGDPALETAARQWTARLEPRQHDATTHDLGFLFELSFLLGFKITGDACLKRPPLEAARTLAQRYNPRGHYIQAWGPLDAPLKQRGRAIIDTMMNLDLLFWASRESADADLSEVAIGHARTVLARQVRPDWSTAHVVDFAPDTGEFLKQDTHQGLSASSCWSRGQSWAVYGLAECYRETGAPIFLDAARRLSEYCLRRLPPDRIPYWDYGSPLIPNDVRDSSAASILASGLLLLAPLEPDRAQAEVWMREAMDILASLWHDYGSRGTSEPCILIHATRSKPHGHMDHGLIYGDYYFMEALTRLLAPDLVRDL